MSMVDLAEIRAQLRAVAQPRPPRPGPLAAIRALIRPAPRPPLLGPPPDYSARRVPPPPENADDALLLDRPLSLELRRQAFGQRDGTPPQRRDEPQSEIVILEAPEVGEALRRLRSSLAPRPEQDAEIPFLPEDFADASADDVEQLYAEAGVPAEGLGAGRPVQASREPSPPTAAQALLARLEQRLTEEQLGFIAVLAGRGAARF